MAKKKKKNANPKSAVPAPEQTSGGKNRKIGLICLFAVLGLLLITVIVSAAIRAEKTNAAFTQTEDTASSQDQTNQQPEDTAASDFDASQTYYADISVKNYGTITVQLIPSAAPITVQNFVELAQQGFYDGTTFHRIMDGFMMQGGDPTGTGTGDSGKNIKGEFSANGWNNPLTHIRGAISMARADPPDSASCQFFIVQSDSTFLDGSYACFGYVTEGMEYVDAICADAEPTDNNGTIPAGQQPVISSIVIRTE